jgi:N-acetylglucosamine kinase-like BadF-type ATPase
MTAEILYVGVDAGGTSTRVAIGNRERVFSTVRSPGSLNPASVGTDTAIEHFERLVVVPVSEIFEDGYSSVEMVVGSAGYGGAAEASFVRRLRESLGRFSRYRVVLMNDVDPLVFGRGKLGAAAIVLGTGSCAVAVARESLVRVGGAEYVASDQGGATYLGQLGLIAAVKAVDGRGDETVLAGRVGSHFDLSVVAASRAVAESAHPKLLLAGLAPVVLDCAYSAGDAVARAIVGSALDEVRVMIGAVLSRCPEAGRSTWTSTGGLLAHWGDYRADVDGVAAEFGLAFDYVDDGSLDCYRIAVSGGNLPAFADLTEVAEQSC